MCQAHCPASLGTFHCKEAVDSPSQGLSPARGSTRVPGEFGRKAEPPGTALRAPLESFISCLPLLLDCEPMRAGTVSGWSALDTLLSAAPHPWSS